MFECLWKNYEQARRFFLRHKQKLSILMDDYIKLRFYRELKQEMVHPSGLEPPTPTMSR